MNLESIKLEVLNVTTLKPATFGKEEKSLLNNVREALSNLTGIAKWTRAAGDDRVDYNLITAMGTLFRLEANRDSLNLNYRWIWEHSTVEFDEHQAGAEINVPNRKMVLGPFMKGFEVNDLEKVILHEFLHAALDDDWQRVGEQSQHGQINQIIKFNLKYPGPPNPANPSEGNNDE